MTSKKAQSGGGDKSAQDVDWVGVGFGAQGRLRLEFAFNVADQ